VTETFLKHIQRWIRTKIQDLGIRSWKQSVQDFSWLAGSHILAIFVGVITLKLTTSIGPEQYGLIVLVSSLSPLLSMFFYGPLEQGFTRYYFDYAKDSSNRVVFLKSFLSILLISLVALGITTLLAAIILPKMFRMTVWFVVMGGCMIAVTSSTLSMNGMLNVMKLRKEISLTQIGEKLFALALLSAVFASGMLDATLVLACISVAGISILGVRIRIYRAVAKGDSQQHSRIVPTTRKEIVRKVATFGTPFMVWGVFGWVQVHGERWVINGLLSSTDVGRYGLALVIIHTTVSMLYNIMVQVVTPTIYSRFSHSNKEGMDGALALVRLFTWMTVILFLVGACMFYWVGDLLVLLVSSREYALDKIIFFILTIGVGLFSAAQTLTIVGLGFKKPQRYVWPKVVVAVLALPLYYFACGWNGILGIAVAVVSINALYIFFVLMVNRRLIREVGLQYEGMA
jgi:O-antigen/teichoic acid export membrane protein